MSASDIPLRSVTLSVPAIGVFGDQPSHWPLGVVRAIQLREEMLAALLRAFDPFAEIVQRDYRCMPTGQGGHAYECQVFFASVFGLPSSEQVLRAAGMPSVGTERDAGGRGISSPPAAVGADDGWRNRP